MINVLIESLTHTILIKFDLGTLWYLKKTFMAGKMPFMYAFLPKKVITGYPWKNEHFETKKTSMEALVPFIIFCKSVREYLSLLGKESVCL